MARWVFGCAAASRPFASIDIHNDTELNPHYACVTRLEPQFIALARLFSRTIVHFERPLSRCCGCQLVAPRHGLPPPVAATLILGGRGIFPNVCTLALPDRKR